MLEFLLLNLQSEASNVQVGTTMILYEHHLKMQQKNYPNVTATVNDGEVTLTGNIISKANDQGSLIRTVKARLWVLPISVADIKCEDEKDF